MITEIEIKDTITKLSGSDKPFAEFLAELFKDKFIEIYIGDSYEEVSTEQISTSYPAVLCGKVVSAYGECLIINSIYSSNDKKIRLGNFLFINQGAIKAITEIDGKGILEETFLRSKESLKIKDLFIDKL